MTSNALDFSVAVSGTNGVNVTVPMNFTGMQQQNFTHSTIYAVYAKYSAGNRSLSELSSIITNWRSASNCMAGMPRDSNEDDYVIEELEDTFSCDSSNTNFSHSSCKHNKYMPLQNQCAGEPVPLNSCLGTEHGWWQYTVSIRLCLRLIGSGKDVCSSYSNPVLVQGIATTMYNSSFNYETKVLMLTRITLGNAKLTLVQVDILVPQENRIQNQSGDPNSGCFPIESSCVTPKQSKRLHSCFFSRTGNGRNIQYSFNVGNAVGNTDFTVASVSTCYGYFASCMPTPFTPIKTMPILAAAASTGAAVLVLTVVVLAFLYTRKKNKKIEAYKQQLALALQNHHENNEMPSESPDYVMKDYDLDPQWELVADSIKLIREVGEGAFGKVYEGILATIEDGDLTVAVKTLTSCESQVQKNLFLTEASIMKKFNSPYVTKLLGVVSTVDVPLVVMEYLGGGDLRDYLVKCRPANEQFFHRSNSETGDNDIPPSDLFNQWALQLARGMLHLHEKHYVHRDLAARNCMLTSDLALKVGDFGLTRDIYESDYYRKTGRGALPIRWLGPESLRDGIFIGPSDVWAYGIVLWEMATLGAQPYQGKANEEVMSFIIGGGHMEAPIVTHPFPDAFFSVMDMCWKFVPQERPKFGDIIEVLSGYLDPIDS